MHANCLMSSHFHLVGETPQAKLVGGMKWLDTYTMCFNRRHKEFGQVFSGVTNRLSWTAAAMAIRAWLGHAAQAAHGPLDGQERQNSAEPIPLIPKRCMAVFDTRRRGRA